MSGKNKFPEEIHLAPKTRKIKVEVGKLILDANNPRFTTCEEDRVSGVNILDDACHGRTLRRMCPKDGDPFKIAQLRRSIVENGWQPVDAMFVQKLEEAPDRYVVLEGNRRLTAINLLLEDEKTREDLKNHLREIDVLEVIPNGQDRELVKKQITYLLGVRHHGSLRPWSAFAQAASIYQRYIELTGLAEGAFEWRKEVGDEVGSGLSIPLAHVKERLKVFVCMRQIGRHPEVARLAGGLPGKYYSLVETPLNIKELTPYFEQDAGTFRLTDAAVERFVKLCRFDNRTESPINEPREWRPFGKILADPDEAKRQDMLSLVEQQINPQRPSKVWAQRSAELRKLNWETWLSRLRLKLSKISLGDQFAGEDAALIVKELSTLLKNLKKKLSA
jgi:hypothetical protein